MSRSRWLAIMYCCDGWCDQMVVEHMQLVAGSIGVRHGPWYFLRENLQRQTMTFHSQEGRKQLGMLNKAPGGMVDSQRHYYATTVMLLLMAWAYEQIHAPLAPIRFQSAAAQLKWFTLMSLIIRSGKGRTRRSVQTSR